MSRSRVHEVYPGCRSARGDLHGGVSACHSDRKRASNGFEAKTLLQARWMQSVSLGPKKTPQK
eukprot:3510642-Amphidinium_carterae.1